MKRVEELLHHLKDQGIQVSLNNEKLVVHAKAGTLSNELKKQLSENKEQILKFLNKDIGSKSPTIKKSGESIAPMTFSQQGMWFIDQLQKGTPEYNMPMALHATGPFDKQLFERIFSTIIERHEVLRSVYALTESYPSQIVRPLNEINFSIDVDDLTCFEGETLDNEVENRVDAELSRPFDLSRDLMLRVKYLKTGNNTGILLFNMHHIASDGWSIEILTNEFFTLYDAYSRNLENPLAPLEIQYADYARWQSTYLTEARLNKQLSYWTEQLKELPVMNALPLDYPRPVIKKSQGKVITSSFSNEVFTSIQKLANQYQLTPFMLVHGAIALLLSQHSGSNDIVIGTPVANRPLRELDPLIGFFVNTIVLRVDTSYSCLKDYFQHLREVHLSAQSNQNLPFEQLVKNLKLPRSRSHNSPLYQVMLTMVAEYGMNNHVKSEPQNTEELSCVTYKRKKVATQFDLNIELYFTEEDGDIHWIYDESLFSEKHIKTLSDGMCALLSKLALLRAVDAIEITTLMT